MNKENKNQLFRLAAVLYADNNYDIAPKIIIKKVLESALISNANKSMSIHQLIDFIYDNYNLHFDEQELESIVSNDKKGVFLINHEKEERNVCLSERRKQTLELKLSNKTIDYFITEFEREKKTLASVSSTKEIIYRFLYELLSTNIESFKKLLDSKNKIEDLIKKESHPYLSSEKEIINDFLKWENNDKDKAIFDIASYALEYCMISNNGGITHIQLNSLKNKIFYLDTNVIFRTLGINGENRQKRTITFLKKSLDTNTSLVISKYSEIEFKETITFYIDKLKKYPINGQINPAIFEEKHFKCLSDLYELYYRWRAEKCNDSLDLFEANILSLYENFKVEFKVKTDYKIPFDEKDEKIKKTIDELSSDICSYKDADGTKHGGNGDFDDACNILLVERKRDGKNANIFDTKYFFVSTDQSLRRWDYSRNSLTPIIILPSQWLSILLRYINRTSDDFKSFVNFLNIPTGEILIDREKSHIILSGISEMTKNFDQQYYLVQILVQKKFKGILENGFKEDDISTNIKHFAKTELQKKVEDISTKHDILKNELDTHKQQTSAKIDGLEEKTGNQQRQLLQKEQENKELKEIFQNNYCNQELRAWKLPAKYCCIPLIILIFASFYFQIFHHRWEYNYIQKLVAYIDNIQSETTKNLFRTALQLVLTSGLLTLIIFCYKRLISKKNKAKKISKINKNMPEKYKSSTP